MDSAYGSHPVNSNNSPDLIERQPLHKLSNNKAAHDRKINHSNTSRASSGRRSTSQRRLKNQRKSFHTSNFFNQTITQMVQGKDRELFPLVNPISHRNTRINKDNEYFAQAHEEKQ